MQEKLLLNQISELANVPSENLNSSIELLTMKSLDAGLSTTINMLKKDFPHLKESFYAVLSQVDLNQDDIVESIIIHSRILKKNLAVYYSLMLEQGLENSQEAEVMF